MHIARVAYVFYHHGQSSSITSAGVDQYPLMCFTVAESEPMDARSSTVLARNNSLFLLPDRPSRTGNMLLRRVNPGSGVAVVCGAPQKRPMSKRPFPVS